MSHHQCFPVSELPPLGTLPTHMWAYTIREERFGSPLSAFQLEEIPVPSIADNEVLIYVMAAGINYNGVWAAKGKPLNVIDQRRQMHQKSHPHLPFIEDFHIAGSDAAGIVWKIGKSVTNVRVGDAVVVQCLVWDYQDPWILAGKDPVLAPSMRVGGYETNYGSFAQFCRVQAHGLYPKPPHLSWAQAAAYMANAATAHRMLFSWPGNDAKEGDIVLVWGGAGGLGCMGIQLAAQAGARVIAVVSSEDKADFCRQLGAIGIINRREFNHWGKMPPHTDSAAFSLWQAGVRAFEEKIWDIVGEKRGPDIVFEHPGEDTLPTSMAVLNPGGMAVICAGTSGYYCSTHLDEFIKKGKRLQGSHVFNTHEAKRANDLVYQGKLDPCLSTAFPFSQLPQAHQLMFENRHPFGNMAVLINAPTSEAGKACLSPTP